MNPLRSRGELVISMTLAETFLLLVFMLWYSIRPTLAGDPKTAVEVLRKENQQLTNKITSLERELADTRSRLELWQKRFDQLVPGTDEELKKALTGGGRGRPRCQEANLLLEINLVNGNTSMKVLADNPLLRATLSKQGIDFRMGNVFSRTPEVDSVLQALGSYRSGDQECRFDYRFNYSTYEDYYVGRERFEKYLYSAGRVQVSNRTN